MLYGANHLHVNRIHILQKMTLTLMNAPNLTYSAPLFHQCVSLLEGCTFCGSNSWKTTVTLRL